jgi:hypothetical protein
MTNKAEIQSLEIGQTFLHSGIEYVKSEEVGNTGGGWCYCHNTATNKSLRFMWNNVVFVK